ncbi:beta-propeller fold lactonase family protein [Cellvibrio polysaccharolyticus]|uniref:beta-propeller fold lactonase family protein n=1 Tax=Cellvibrio polysaccharolyticus TaxID=2082724 RepID=UPI00187E7397|nr:beta-propeller fold lactonase family protein [Cellvibrio polysaccharolyticus]
MTLFLIGAAAQSQADTVNYIETQVNAQNDVVGLDGISDIAVSPDGKFVYASSYRASAVSVFERNLLNGQLTYRSTITGAIAAFSVDVSGDGESVYAASPTGGKIFAYSRNAETGALTVVNSVGTVGGTAGFVSVSVSPDSKHVYGVGGQPSGLVVFGRDQETGDLTVLFDYKDNVDGHELGQQFSPTFSPIKNIVTSADGQFVYVTSTVDSAITLFSRNATTGALTQVAVYKNGTNGVDGILTASSAKRSPDGKHLYVTGQSENSVAVFSIDSTTGELTYLDKMTNGAGGIEKLTGARSLAVSPDGRYVMVSAITANALTIFSRNASTGLLTLDSVVNNNANSVIGLSAPSGMSTDPLNRHLYVAGQADSALVVFSLPTPAVSLTTTTATAQVSGAAVTLDNALSIFDSDSTHLLSATVSITSGFISTDTLAVQTVAGISASYDSAVGILTLSGNATLADYQTALRSLSYQAGADPSLAAGASSSRNIAFSVTDTDNNTSAPAAITVAVEKPDGFTVTFVDWDSAVLSSQLITSGGAATAPAAPGRTGYGFTGWDLAFDNVTADLTVTAQYTINTYRVTFNLDGGSRTGGGTLTQTVDYGLAATAPVFTGPAGTTFTGWSTVFDTVTADLTVTAQYSINSYSVIFNLDGGSRTGGGALAQTVNYGEAAIAPVLNAPAGKTFSGWSGSFDNVTANLTITAQYTINTYTVTFNLDGGSRTGGGALAQTVNYGEAATAPVLSAPAGKTFSGWSGSFDNVTANLTITAQYTINTYTVTFNLDGGSRTGGGALAQTVNYGEAATAPVFTGPAGTTFTGWSGSFDNVTANLTITAQYAANTFTVTFNLDGGSRHGGGALSQAVSHGGAATEPVFAPPVGKTFSGWNRSFNNVTSNLTITAQYTLNSHTVTVNVVGDGVVTPNTRQVPSGSVATFTLNLMRAGDYVSLGGSCNAALSGSQIVTAAITADCVINVSVHASLEINNDTDKPLVSSEPGRFRVLGGVGEKTLTEALLKRAGKETLLEPAVAESLISAQADGSYVFSSNLTGRYTLTFVDVVSGERGQVSFDVLPYVAFTSSRQPVQQDVATTLRVWLSDEPIDYPVVVDFTGTGARLSVERFELTEEDNLLRTFNVVAIADGASVSLQQEGLVKARVGTPSVHDLTVQQQLPSLALRVVSEQNGQQSTVVNAMGGEVVLNVAELNDGAATYEWSSDGLILIPNGDSASFNPAMVPPGVYIITVHATTLDGRTGRYDLAQRVVADCEIGSCENTGTSGIPASVNPFAAAPNRIPVCPNVNEAANRVESCRTIGSEALYAEVPRNYALSIGELSGNQSWETGQFGIAVNDQSLSDPGYDHLGATLNFDVTGLEHAGEAVSVAIGLPIGTLIPEKAVWRKFIDNQWHDFVADDHNQLHSASRNALGQCPGVSADSWQEGLVQGLDCVRLTIEDGGPYDADGVANSVIRDPGVLAVALATEEPKPPVTPTPPVNEGKGKSGGSLGMISLLLLGLMGVFRSRRLRNRVALSI